MGLGMGTVTLASKRLGKVLGRQVNPLLTDLKEIVFTGLAPGGRVVAAWGKEQRVCLFGRQVPAGRVARPLGYFDG